MLNLNAAKKNAKIAGINKSIDFSRTDTEWLDIKVTKEKVDEIVTHLPGPSKAVNEKDAEEIYDQFFYQAEFILKKTGVIITISRETEHVKKAAAKYSFISEKEIDVFSGKAPLKILILKNKKTFK